MTFHSKKHAETLRWWSRGSAGPFICCTLPEQAFAGLCECVCVFYLWVKWVPPKCNIYMGCWDAVKSCGSHWKGQRLKVGYETDWEGLGGMTSLRKSSGITRWNKCDLFLLQSLKKEAKFAHFQIILYLLYQVSCLGCSMDACQHFFNFYLVIQSRRKKKIDKYTGMFVLTKSVCSMHVVPLLLSGIPLISPKRLWERKIRAIL